MASVLPPTLACCCQDWKCPQSEVGTPNHKASLNAEATEAMRTMGIVW